MNGKYPQELASWIATRTGYRMVTVSRDGAKKNVSVHRCLLWAFVGPPPFPAAQAHHANDIRLDNRLENLRWGTAGQNQADSAANGTKVRGEMSPRAKLTETAVRAMREAFAGGDSIRGLARANGVSQRTAQRILREEAWAWAARELVATATTSSGQRSGKQLHVGAKKQRNNVAQKPAAVRLKAEATQV